jgi:hypothetical protein
VTLDFAIARINQLDKPTAWADGWTFRPGGLIDRLVGTKAKSQLTSELVRRFGDARSLVGLKATGVYRRSAELDRRYDAEISTSFCDGLRDEMKDHGYYYFVEIGGLVRPGQPS